MFLHMSLKEDKTDVLCGGTIKKKGPGFFFSRKKQLDRLLFFLYFTKLV